MDKNDDIEFVLKNLIQQTQQALEEGWIHSQEFGAEVVTMKSDSLVRLGEATN